MASSSTSKYQLLKSLLNDERVVVLRWFETGKGFGQCTIVVKCFVPLADDYAADELWAKLYTWLDASSSKASKSDEEKSLDDSVTDSSPCTIHAFDLIAGTFKPIPIASVQVKRVAQQQQKEGSTSSAPGDGTVNAGNEPNGAANDGILGGGASNRPLAGYLLQVQTEAFEACVDLYAIMIMKERSLVKLYQHDGNMTVQTHVIRVLNLHEGAFPAHLEFALHAQARNMKRSYGDEINYARYVKIRDAYIKQLPC